MNVWLLLVFCDSMLSHRRCYCIFSSFLFQGWAAIIIAWCIQYVFLSIKWHTILFSIILLQLNGIIFCDLCPIKWYWDELSSFKLSPIITFNTNWILIILDMFLQQICVCCISYTCVQTMTYYKYMFVNLYNMKHYHMHSSLKMQTCSMNIHL